MQLVTFYTHSFLHVKEKKKQMFDVLVDESKNRYEQVQTLIIYNVVGHLWIVDESFILVFITPLKA